MKTWTVRFREVDKARFEEVRSGKKLYETRAATVKYASIQEGDVMKFVCGNESFEKKIGQKFHFKTVDELFEVLPLKKVMPDIDSVEDAKARYATYPDYPAKIKEHGLFAFEFADL